MFKTSSYTHAMYAPAKPVCFVPDSVLHLKRNVSYRDGPGGATHPTWAAQEALPPSQEKLLQHGLKQTSR